jgi:hypothetical protein
LILKRRTTAADALGMPGRARTPDRREALTTARRLVARGEDYDAIVWRLVFDLGFDERSARALTAEAFRPTPTADQSLRSELDAIARMLDAAAEH